MRWLVGTIVGVGFGLALVGGLACSTDTNAGAPVGDAAITQDVTAEGTAPDAHVRRPGPMRVLFFTKETLYFHNDAHERGDLAVPAYLRARGHEVTVTNDSAIFDAARLDDFDVALFFVTSGVVLDAPQRDAFEGFIRAGGGFAGVHTASITDSDSAFFRGLVGATFLGHGVGDAGVSTSSLIVVAPADPLVSFLPNPWVRADEWYYFIDDPAKNAALAPLLRLDESTLPAEYPEAGLTSVHPLSWTQSYMGARSFYTALGHTGASYQDDLFLRSIALGVEWAGAPR